MKKYQPNFNDPRTRSRVQQALGFVEANFSPNKSLSRGTRWIDEHLGQRQNPLSNWLRGHLLTASSPKWNWHLGQCKQYTRNDLGMSYVKDQLNRPSKLTLAEWSSPTQTMIRQRMNMDTLISHDEAAFTPTRLPDLAHKWLWEEYHSDLINNTIQYQDKSSRLWHPLQMVRREYKQGILARAGLLYQYDIECAAPTLILQHSQFREMDLYLFAINKYLKDRTEIRQQLAEQTDIEVDTAKRIITALFAGAQLGHNPSSDIYKMLDGDPAKIEFLKQHDFIKELRADIQTCWTYIRAHLDKKYTITKRGTMRLRPLSSRDKWHVYFNCERAVLEVVINYLDTNGFRYFLEHDGWTTDKPIQTDDLLEVIEQQLGFRLKLDGDVLN